MTPKDMGPRIKRRRLELKMTQAHLAEMVGVHRVNLARMETADQAKRHLRPSLPRLERLAEALKSSVGDLLGERRRKKRT